MTLHEHFILLYTCYTVITRKPSPELAYWCLPENLQVPDRWPGTTSKIALTLKLFYFLIFLLPDLKLAVCLCQSGRPELNSWSWTLRAEQQNKKFFHDTGSVATPCRKHQVRRVPFRANGTSRYGKLTKMVAGRDLPDRCDQNLHFVRYFIHRLIYRKN